MTHSFIAFMSVFSIIVIVHEAGHFIAARKSGVKVYEFSIGFPISPRLCTLFYHQETAFTLRLLPLGGFVSFSQEGNEAMPTLFTASNFNRFLILAAGSSFNIVFAFLLFIPFFIIGEDLQFMEAVARSGETLWEILSGTIGALASILVGQGSTAEFVGPVGIATLAGKAASHGLLSFFYFTGVLSMSLGIMNLLPLPSLDGGQLLMLLIETVRRKPLALQTYQAVNLIGFALFIVLSILVTYKDVVTLLV